MRKQIVKRPHALMVVLCLLLHAGVFAAGAFRIQRGMPLSDALLELQRGGVRLIFTSRVVLPEMAVGEVPASVDPRQILDAILAPHSLGLQAGAGGMFVVVPIRRPPHGESAKTAVEPTLHVAEEIVVESDAGDVDPAVRPSTTLSAYEVEALPHAGNDVFRALTLLPGTASADTSSQLQVRGARENELLIRLDGQELYEPYHLREFDNALSIVTASRVAKVNLVTALPTSHGDRAAGVLDMVTASAAMQPRLRIGLSLIETELQTAHALRDGRLGLSASFRRGTTDLLGRAFGVEEPVFYDLFAKADIQITPRHNVRFHILGSLDELQYNQAGEIKRLDTEYLGSYSWFSHRAIVTNTIFADTVISIARTQRERGGIESDPDRTFVVSDRRTLDARSVVQRWNVQAGDAHAIGAGAEYEHFRATYDYATIRNFNSPLVRLRTSRELSFALDDYFDRVRFGIYAYDRIRLREHLTLEAGLRYDAHTADDDSVVSPRVSTAWSTGSNVVHLGWGEYSQSHRAYEVMAEDGDARLYPAEHSRQWVAGIEHIFPASSAIPLDAVRAELYRRTVSNPRPRYRNLFDGFDAFPEGQLDRVRISPERGAAQGLELSVRGRGAPRIRWWMNYTLASTREQVGGVEVPRETDQTHTFNADLNIAAGRGWNINGAFVYRTGWPTTPVSIERQIGADGVPELIPILGQLNSRRFPNYHRLDLRVSREWTVRTGSVSVFADARNIYDRRNVAGIELELDVETATLTRRPERWPGVLGTVGVVWRWR